MKFRASFRIKLLLLTIVPLGIAQVVTLLAVMRTIERDVELRANDSLTTGALVVQEYLTARAEQLRTSVEVMAADFGLKEAVAIGDASTTRSVLENHGNRIGADFLAILDLDAVPIVSTVNIGATSLVDPRLLDGDADLSSRETTAVIATDAYHVFIVPLRAPTTIAWIVSGFRADQELASRVGELTGLEIAFVHSDSPATTVVTTSKTTQELWQLNSDNGVVYETDSQGELSLAIQTEFVPGDESLLVVLQRSLRVAMLPYVEARRGLILFSAALLVLVAAAAAWLSTTIAQPLKTLGAAARRMISGNYKTNVSVRSDDEFGELATSFNAMQSAIAEREQRISHHAMHDPLTDLPNSTKILNALSNQIESARKNETTIAILSIGLVRMSEISSTLGHTATNELIRMAARHLRASLDETEILGHTGTNQFVLILPGQDSDSAMAYVDRIAGLLGSGVTLGRINVILQTEIGVAEFPRHGDSAADMLRLAAIARTEAEASREPVRVYQPGREDEFVRRLRIANDLPAALRRGDVQVWYQPKISLPSGDVCGAEALVRWEHPELGFLQPDDFIPAAEQSGTIVVLTRHVIAAAVRECSEWQKAGHDLQISVNLSARDLQDEYLPYQVMQILNEHDLDAGKLTLEITENSIMDNLRHAVSVLECLRDIGIRIAMDDFGTGHSSLAQLRDIPLHELKIDKSFVMSLTNDEHNDTIVKTTVNLAHSMRLQVVAEGVEDIETMRRIAEIGCEQAQGYFVSKPMPATKIRNWLHNFEPVSFASRRKSNRPFSNYSS